MEELEFEGIAILKKKKKLGNGWLALYFHKNMILHLKTATWLVMFLLFLHRWDILFLNALEIQILTEMPLIGL